MLDYLMDNSTGGLLNVELELSQKVCDTGSMKRPSTRRGLTRCGPRRARARRWRRSRHVAGRRRLERSGALAQQDIDAVVLSQDINDKRRLDRPRVSRRQDRQLFFIDHKSWASVLDETDGCAR